MIILLGLTTQIEREAHSHSAEFSGSCKIMFKRQHSRSGHSPIDAGQVEQHRHQFVASLPYRECYIYTVYVGRKRPARGRFAPTHHQMMSSEHVNFLFFCISPTLDSNMLREPGVLHTNCHYPPLYSALRNLYLCHPSRV